MTQEEWSKMYLDKDSPYDFWEDKDDNKTNMDDLTSDLQSYTTDENVPEVREEATEEATEGPMFSGFRLKQDEPTSVTPKPYSNSNYSSNRQPYGNVPPYGNIPPYGNSSNNSTLGNVVPNRSNVFDREHFPIITIMLVVANVIAFCLCMRTDENHILSGGINYEYITKNHEFGRFISYMFLHSGFEHLANNMVMLWMFGHFLEQKLGSLRTMIIYFVSGVGAGVGSTFVSHMINPNQVRFCVGASGAVFGII